MLGIIWSWHSEDIGNIAFFPDISFSLHMIYSKLYFKVGEKYTGPEIIKWFVFYLHSEQSFI